MNTIVQKHLVNVLTEISSYRTKELKIQVSIQVSRNDTECLRCDSIEKHKTHDPPSVIRWINNTNGLAP
jgi:hypothetical protein